MHIKTFHQIQQVYCVNRPHWLGDGQDPGTRTPDPDSGDVPQPCSEVPKSATDGFWGIIYGSIAGFGAWTLFVQKKKLGVDT